MAQTHEGVIKILAAKTGLTVAEYKRRRHSGLKWCWKCKLWKNTFEYNKDNSRYDGLSSKCRSCCYVQVRMKRVGCAPNTKVRNQASNAVRTAIRQGRMIKPSGQPCFYCSGKATGYHHYLGYSQAHWLDVKPSCRKCHVNLHWE